LWMYQRVFFGQVTNPKNLGLLDLNLREIVVLVPLVICIGWIGAYPKPFLQRMEPSVAHLINQVKAKSVMVVEMEKGTASSRFAWFATERTEASLETMDHIK